MPGSSFAVWPRPLLGKTVKNICWPEERTSWALQMSHRPCQTDPHSSWVRNSPGTAIRESGEEGLRCCQDLGRPSVERTDCPGGRKGRGLPEEHQDGLGFPHRPHSGREYPSSPCKGARSEVELPVPAWIWAGQAPAFHQWIQEWLVWPEIFSAHQDSLGLQLDNKRND